MSERLRVEPGTAYRLVALSGGLGEPETTVTFERRDDALVARFHALAEPPLTIGVLEGNGPVFRDECVELFLGSASDPGRYLELVVNPLGVLYAARVVNPHDDRSRWELTAGVPAPGVEVAIGGPEGAPPAWSWWSARITVPFAMTQGVPDRVNATRIARGARTSHLALSPTLRDSPPDFHVPSRFAELR